MNEQAIPKKQDKKERNILYVYKQEGCSPVIFKDVKVMNVAGDTRVSFISEDGTQTTYSGFPFVLKTWWEDADKEQ